MKKKTLKVEDSEYNTTTMVTLGKP